MTRERAAERRRRDRENREANQIKIEKARSIWIDQITASWKAVIERNPTDAAEPCQSMAEQIEKAETSHPPHRFLKEAGF